MQAIADLHLHSKYSRAVSKYMDIFEIARGASRKGIDLVTTGDFQHPLHFEQIRQELREVSEGIYELKHPIDLPHASPKFMLVTEVSCIYVDKGKGRRIHYLIFAPSIEVAASIGEELQNRRVDLRSDGRPILTFSSKALLEILLDIDPHILLVPAHAWTPWFGLYGSKSGYDSLEECFGDLSSHICAVETGLSSDPKMNWGIPELKNRSILSFSDAHSAPKMGREATVFSVPEDFSYQLIHDCITGFNKTGIVSTIEFYPEEGKYHWSGHRACNVCMSPEEVMRNGPLCPVCGRPLTLGVAGRVADLSEGTANGAVVTNQENERPTVLNHPKGNRPPYESLIPLEEICREVCNGSPTKGKRLYDMLVADLPEFEILRTTSYERLEKLGGEQVAEAVRKVRERRVAVRPGYDGVFGTITLS